MKVLVVEDDRESCRLRGAMDGKRRCDLEVRSNDMDPRRAIAAEGEAAISGMRES